LGGSVTPQVARKPYSLLFRLSVFLASFHFDGRFPCIDGRFPLGRAAGYQHCACDWKEIMNVQWRDFLLSTMALAALACYTSWSGGADHMASGATESAPAVLGARNALKLVGHSS
jgi:hypothetical protein